MKRSAVTLRGIQSGKTIRLNYLGEPTPKDEENEEDGEDEENEGDGGTAGTLSQTLSGT